MRKYLKLIAGYFYWTFINIKYNCKVSQYSLSIKSEIGKYVKIRNKNYIYGRISIGDYSYISGPSSIINPCKIGKYCSIARGVIIGPGNHPLTSVSSHPFLYRKEYDFIKKDLKVDYQSIPIIGNDVWIGMNSIIMKGVKIGDGAIIAAGSIVTKDVEPFSIVGGIPAKHIKYRFSKDECERLKKIRWWNWEHQKIIDKLNTFNDISLFLDHFE